MGAFQSTNRASAPDCRRDDLDAHKSRNPNGPRVKFASEPVIVVALPVDPVREPVTTGQHTHTDDPMVSSPSQPLEPRIIGLVGDPDEYVGGDENRAPSLFFDPEEHYRRQPWAYLQALQEV